MERMRIASDAKVGLDFEDRLFAEKGSHVGFWTTMGSSLVCPKAYKSRFGFNSASKRSETRNWPVRLRRTGGGVVPQAPAIDNLVLAFDAPRNFSLEDGYRLIVEVVRTGLGEVGKRLEAGAIRGSFCDGGWNLSINGKKIVGTAQRWRQRHDSTPRVLAHAVLLTREGFLPGIDAVSSFHSQMGLGPIYPGVHSSLEAEFDIKELPVTQIHAAATSALEKLQFEFD